MISKAEFLRNTKATEPYHIIEPFVRLFGIKDTEEFLSVISAALTELLDVNYDNNDQELYQQCKRYARWKQVVESKTFRTSCTKFFAKKTAAATSTPATTANTFRRSDRIKEIQSPAAPVKSLTEEEIRIDGLFLKKDTETIGQRIKQRALDLEATVTSPEFKDVHERRIFSLGASSILDLVDMSNESQLFDVFPSKSDQDELMTMFAHLSMKRSINAPEPTELLTHWDICSAIASKDGLAEARSYLYREMGACLPSFAENLKPLLIMIDALLCYPKIFAQEYDVTEQDLMNVLWSPMLSSLFLRQQSETGIRIKGGDSTQVASNIEKREFYDDGHAIAFKIDSRIIIDVSRKGEIDIAAVEVAPNCQETKIFSDGAKVLREAKEIVNGLTKIFPDDENFLKNTIGYGVQIGNLSGSIFSLHLVAPKLYVAWPEHTFCLPDSRGSLDRFKEVIIALSWFQQAVQGTAMNIKSALSVQKTVGALYGHGYSHKPLGQKQWTNPTWFEPSKPSKARPIQELMRVVHPIQTAISPQSSEDLNKQTHANATYDSNGWAIVVAKDGRPMYFNKHTLQYLEERGGKKAKMDVA
ncbi:hypothetical protein BX616_010753 [Lobosporangium transversale]|uniref:Uncharacterized protein n=1 Tax=Lobosporangium transversale TaxID=64571 RepID=A0A1Y2GNV0_9FUNG|nr:hypothetical protein BCR41DRAFT_423019 [Lobosporangium transversale]KAF9910908.1 hypothetical protein BX616_010753 [Lobosporangium transversale]ORZ12944.1 hypothetical protein BCR41DRAFT_423019 [Lobosporangium transversale]|eukprot:XP_021880293.1 hypothetical protein BCR41DRAFT_423019 [Lobosporangium transversale]